MTTDLRDRALREAREVCPAAPYRHSTGMDQRPPAECECCRRIAALVIRTRLREAKTTVAHDLQASYWAGLEAAAAELAGGEEG